ncbi:MAG: alpha-D-ribose 1-methylphosphonate 5-triphosphate diphosphatase [Azospirillum sp.]|nr:alpha-D-ribose 1-methylphosphonate 5-triphosphate diphosphatase [Azospirillum sp.]
MQPEAILTNAQVVTGSEQFTGTVVMRDGQIAEIDRGRSRSPAAEDLDGEFLLPGLVELHTDNLERHFMPRPGVVWPSALAAVLTHDGQAIGAGITTVLDAVCVGEYREGGRRRVILSESVATVTAARGQRLLRAEHFLHLRCEVADPCVVEMFEPNADHPLLRLVSLMDHTPGQRQWQDLGRFRDFHRQADWTDDRLDALVAEQLITQARFAASNRFDVVAQCRARGIPLASHDDTLAEHVREAVADGITLSEFPTSRPAAEEARRHGLAIILGAPNLVRGESHSGNVSAGTLADDRLVDVLSSDYVPASLLHAAFLLRDRHGWSLPDAVRTVSAAPAQRLGLADRGEIAPGRRADLIRVRPVGDFPVVRAVWVAGSRVQ